ncbi:hypothetical protein IscW_ISCW012140 [Ixodes scapularis]|uniref:C-type lectin domain-containing protein n=1 Tax=Ixodes scapularis TaxID=6945 RepID=B7QF92_IXOSC|nr:hypothetical protein IscW_ISCW012140 [Ixodes scapularis]|eukprot:XP_002414206.1 hypothetical protein IscW_ISCW012140 [Ixodes scapularis]
MYEETDPLQWYEAEAKCGALGKGRSGHLVSILDEKEMAIIHYFLTDIWKAHKKSLYIGEQSPGWTAVGTPVRR